MRATIETSRLILRPLESDDADAAFTWFGNPIVIRVNPGTAQSALRTNSVSY